MTACLLATLDAQTLDVERLRRLAEAAAVLAIEAEVATLERARMLAMRRDYQTVPHRDFPQLWPDWKAYADVLPTFCGCNDCRLWRSGS